MMIMSRFDKQDLFFYSSVLVIFLTISIGCARSASTVSNASPTGSTSTASKGTTVSVTTNCTGITLQEECCNSTECIFFNCESKPGCFPLDTTAPPCTNNCTQEPVTTAVPIPTTTNGTQTTQISPNTSSATTTAPITTITHHTTTTASKSTTTEDITTIMTTSASQSARTGQHFDSASFIGGIVLCAGLVAIAYFGCKFYKAKTDRNYHTL